MSVVTLERLLQAEGLGSRRECRGWIMAGAVSVNQQPVTDPQQTFPRDGTLLSFNDEQWFSQTKLTVLLHKPAGVECSHNPSHHPPVHQLLPIRLRQRGLQCVGRLDQDTTGLLLLTDDGALNHALTSPKHHVPKTYLVTTAHALTPKMLADLLAGVVLRDDPHPVFAQAAEPVDSHQLRLVITEGRYHQVKRMLAAVGNRVVALHREAIGALTLPTDLACGQWATLSAQQHSLLAN